MKTFVLILLVVALASCAGASYSKYDSFSGKGYEETKISDDHYSVMFQGDGQNTPLQVKNLFMRRCADLAISSGYEYFEVSKEQPGQKLNGPVAWPSYSGEVKFLKKKTNSSFDAKSLLKNLSN